MGGGEGGRGVGDEFAFVAPTTHHPLLSWQVLPTLFLEFHGISEESVAEQVGWSQ